MKNALMIRFNTPNAQGHSKVHVTACDGFMAIYDYDINRSREENAASAAQKAFAGLGMSADFELGKLPNFHYCATQVAERFVKARDAVILTRQAISKGENNGNPHARAWGQAITDLTDGVQADGFAKEYTAAVMRGSN